ncbi:hypothetical protein FRC03_008767 [Tulasnella sp. 419]|nr:hypothetical protein FRC02_004461 [Tulasnella sp. 418]KAG8968068.1 hypothetical protein FRC03_008767 [Tulasnella sp. 419]
MIRAVICLPDGGFDATQVALPWHILTSRGCIVDVATERGDVPSSEQATFQGVFRKLFAPNAEAVAVYHRFIQSSSFLSPRSWSSSDFSFMQYDCVILPGCSEKRILQMVESKSLKDRLLEYIPYTLENGPTPRKICAASGRGVLCLALAEDEDGNSIIRERQVTTLPVHLERLEYFATSKSCPWMIRQHANMTLRQALKDSSQYQCGPFVMTNSSSNSAFVTKDGGLITSRWQGDALAWGEAIWEELMKLRWQE